MQSMGDNDELLARLVIYVAAFGPGSARSAYLKV
jgi:hypothetical protein